MNKLYLHSYRDSVTLKIGTSDHGRRVTLTSHEAAKLGHKLMSLAAGGTTFGMEEFRVEKVDGDKE